MNRQKCDTMTAMETTRAPRTAWLVVLAVGIAATLDAISTYAGLHRGLSEQNGLAADLFNTVGLIPILVLRVLIPAAIVFFALRLTGGLRGKDRMLHSVTCGAFLFVAVAWTMLAASNTFGWL